MIAGSRLDGLIAPAVFDGPIDNPTSLAYAEQVLVPTLRPGDVVVFDKLAVHKEPEAAERSRASGRVRALPGAPLFPKAHRLGRTIKAANRSAPRDC